MPIIDSLLHGFLGEQNVSVQMWINQIHINAISADTSIRKYRYYEWERRGEEEKHGEKRRIVRLW